MKGLALRGTTNKEGRIMSIGRKTDTSDKRIKALEPRTRSLLEAIKVAPKATTMPSEVKYLGGGWMYIGEGNRGSVGPSGNRNIR